CYLDDWPSGFRAALMTKPGYPTPRNWCDYLQLHYQELPLHPRNSFRFSTDDIRKPTHLIMMNYPHNPSGQTASRRWLEELCGFCENYDIRLFNDAAYVPLTHRRTSCTLAEVAINFPDLSWLEAYSASKAVGNGTGWRVGAMVGSPDFVKDLSTIKGNTDSGFVAFSAAGVIDAVEHDIGGMGQHRRAFGHRLKILIQSLTAHGMQLAVQPGAGFFTLWKVPKGAFGEEVVDAEHFNRLMIERTGVVGVHFNPDYIRYAVVGDVEAMLPEIDEAFAEAAISYN
ncbi:MAG TPA: aminotransferase class I/II-fold pyridoxal phosphate-dependent enzyme, partial [Candidatus Nanoarchaeia archaeon]